MEETNITTAIPNSDLATQLVTTGMLDTTTPPPPPLLPQAPTSPSQPPTDNTSFSSPVSVLPLVISLATLVTIIIAACVIYRKRQNKRSQELARQLRVTERKIDAIGNLKAKKEQELLGLTSSNRKAEYNPPATAPCSSATSLETHPAHRDSVGVKFVVPQQHTLSHRMKEDEAAGTGSSTEYELKLCEASIEANKAPSSLAGSTYTGTQSREEDENDESSLYYCSTCQDSVGAGVVEVERRRNKAEPSNSSMAVECETIPTASSLSTVIGTVLSRPNHVARSQSEHHHMNANKQSSQNKRLSTISAWTHVQNYTHIIRNLRYSSKYQSSHQSGGGGNTVSKATNSTVHTGSWGATNHIYSSINPALSTATGSYFPVPPQSYGSRTVSSSRREEGSGRPNTPVSNVTDTTTDTDGEKEKWV